MVIKEDQTFGNPLTNINNSQPDLASTSACSAQYFSKDNGLWQKGNTWKYVDIKHFKCKL
jgi:hypothetical protein